MNKQKYAIHATFVAYLPKIVTEGLKPTSNQNWSCDPGVYVVIRDDKDEAIEVAMSFCEAADVPNDILEEGIVALEITNFDMGEFEVDPNMLLPNDVEPYTFVTKKVIAPEFLRIVSEFCM